MNDLEHVSEHRAYLVSVAYRMLSSVADAEDVVQEAFIRYMKEARDDVRAPRAFLTTIVTRLCLDRMKDAHHKRVDYVGPWLPEPLMTSTMTSTMTSATPDAADNMMVLQSISQAFLVMLERLTPLQRAVLLLHDVFDYDHKDIAAIVERDVAAVRKTLERARRDVQQHRPRFAPTTAAHRRMVEAFAMALMSSDTAALSQVLAADVVATSDGGGKANAARNAIVGSDHVARFFIGISKMPAVAGKNVGAVVADVNGWPALVVTLDDVPYTVIQLETDGETIYAVRSVLNPDKLRAISV